MASQLFSSFYFRILLYLFSPTTSSPFELLVVNYIERVPFRTFKMDPPTLFFTNSEKMLNKNCQGLDSNPGPLVSEATALSTLLHLLPQKALFCVISASFPALFERSISY